MRYCPQCEERYLDEVMVCPDDGEETLKVPETLSERLKGRTLDGRWVVGDVLGEGGMGAVFSGHQKRLDRPVAIKVLRPELAQLPRVVSRFMREAKTLSSLRHPHIVTIFDFGRDEETGVLYLIMELLKGQAVNDWLLRREEITGAQITELAVQIARALDDAHKQGIIHRDLKPHNVLLSPVAGGFHAKVLDFGIAKINQSSEEALTRTGDIQGTPHYMAPEQARGEEITPATDIYALGVMLYQMIAGTPPFEAATPMAILLKHVGEPFEPLKANWNLDEPINESLVQLTEDMLAKAPDDRPATARELLSRLEEITFKGPRNTLRQFASAEEMNSGRPLDDEQVSIDDGEQEPAIGPELRENQEDREDQFFEEQYSSQFQSLALPLTILAVLLTASVLAAIFLTTQTTVEDEVEQDEEALVVEEWEEGETTEDDLEVIEEPEEELAVEVEEMMPEESDDPAPSPPPEVHDPWSGESDPQPESEPDPEPAAREVEAEVVPELEQSQRASEEPEEEESSDLDRLLRERLDEIR